MKIERSKIRSQICGRPGVTGIRIIATLRSANTDVLTEFKFFKNFIEQQTQNLFHLRSAEFYHNFGSEGFAGIDCFRHSHISVRTFPGHSDIHLDIFICDTVSTATNLGIAIYDRTISFFQSEVLYERIEFKAHWIPPALFSLKNSA